MEKIWQIVMHTPIWVYILLLYLIFVGVRAAKTRVTKLYHIVIMPMILFTMSILMLVGTITECNGVVVGSWSIGLVIGSIGGWRQVKNNEIQVDRKNWLIRIPGSWSSMWIILLIFAIRYYFGYQKAILSIVVEQLWFKVSILGSSGLCTGLIIGKMLRYFVCFKNAESRENGKSLV
ncbi:DUF6622 family protein [Anaerosinus massiliensis]|uniref:DUF6622 family protein n=1 Tax=Massilibacillus massiliensis TaxID=1806837 RepID=UPI000DA61E7A|nr:DUF6622 family protein [Massilibacillus massiliensis]